MTHSVNPNLALLIERAKSPDPEYMANFLRRHTSHKGSCCSAEGCMGILETRLVGVSSGIKCYSTAICNTCGQTYRNAPDARVVGTQEFKNFLEYSYSI